MPRRLCRPLGCMQLGLGLSLEGGQRFCWLTFIITPGGAGALKEHFVSAGRPRSRAPGEMLCFLPSAITHLGWGSPGAPEGVAG